jgi:hypothetical protein
MSIVRSNGGAKRASFLSTVLLLGIVGKSNRSRDRKVRSGDEFGS